MTVISQTFHYFERKKRPACRDLLFKINVFSIEIEVEKRHFSRVNIAIFRNSRFFLAKLLDGKKE